MSVVGLQGHSANRRLRRAVNMLNECPTAPGVRDDTTAPGTAGLSVRSRVVTIPHHC